jgi:hypothetical protein
MRAILCLTLLSAVAAADVTPLSKLPSRPAHAAHRVPAPEHAAEFVHELSAYEQVLRFTPPYCGVANLPGGWMDGEGELTDLRLSRGREVAVTWGPQFFELGLERLIEHEGRAILERTRMLGAIDHPDADRTQIALVPVGHLDDTTIYAYRNDESVFVIARSAPGTWVRVDDSGAPLTSGHREDEQTCDFAITELRVPSRSSQNARIWNPKRCTRIDASITKTSRDPEPLLAVTARHVDCR